MHDYNRANAPHWSWSVAVEPVSEPITLAEAKAHLKVDVADDDALITAEIVAARKWAEQYCNRAIPRQTILATFDGAPPNGGNILLPQSPVYSITAISYIDNNGAVQTWDSSLYAQDLESSPARISPAYGESWPSIRQQNNALFVLYVAGESAIQAPIIHAIKMIVGSLYANRENDCTKQSFTPSMSVKALLDMYKLYYRGPW